MENTDVNKFYQIVEYTYFKFKDDFDKRDDNLKLNNNLHLNF